MDITIELNDYTKNDAFYNRIAARAIIFCNNKLLMVPGKYGDYKFPGGGMEPDEVLTDTLVREVFEETGLRVMEDSIMPYGQVYEKRSIGPSEKLIMVSHYFLCQLEEYENCNNVKGEWIRIEDAIESNGKITDYENCPWAIRAKLVMEFILQDKDKKISFYEDFRCTAKQCEITCCREWKIEVDDGTYANWKKLPEKPYLCTKKIENRRVIKLSNEMKCPFLEDGLCSLVVKYGEACISNTCQIFPRQINEFPDRREWALVNCCPEVINIINRQKRINYNRLGNDGLFAVRDRVIDIIQNRRYSIEEGFIIAFYSLIAEDFDENEVYNELKKIKVEPVDSYEECNELFLDLSINYINEGMYKEYLVNWFDTAEELAENGISEEEISSFAQIFSTFKQLICKCMAAELFANLYLDEYDLEAVTVSLQWIAMEYVAIRQSCFLEWKNNGNLEYNDVKLCITVISRMMGYDEPDIREYMENSFENLIWEPGYLALIMGETKES